MAHFTINHLYKVQVSEKTQFDLAEVERRTKRTLDALMHCKKKEETTTQILANHFVSIKSYLFIFL